MPSKSRDEAEAALAVVVTKSTRTYLQRVLDAIQSALRSGRYDQAQPLLALGVLMNWWTDEVGEGVVEEIKDSWQAAFGVTAREVTTPRADAMAFHLAAVRDRLSRSAQPEIPEAAFDQVRLAQSVGALNGRSIDEMSRDIAERLAWEPDKGYWKAQKQLAEDEIDAILDPLGRPGSAARTIAHQSDPGVKLWQGVRAEALDRINEDESVWQARAERIARTEATSAWNSGSLAALADEGVAYKEWLSHIDDRTRDSHREADGQVVAMTKPFRVGQSLLMMPGDPAAPPWETVNCRCTVVGAEAPSRAITASITDEIDAWLAETPDLVVASGWQDQLRIPKGNGDLSGRWTFTPWKHLDDLVGLLNALGPDSEPSTRASVREALDALAPFDPSNLDPHDETFQQAVAHVADILDEVKPTGDESLDDAIMQASAGVREFADADWSLFAEETDIDYVDSAGQANKNVWEGDVPSDNPVNLDLEGVTSQELVDELARIKSHPVAPSPSARRKRATYLKELQDRRDRDLQGEVTDVPEPGTEQANGLTTTDYEGEVGNTTHITRTQTGFLPTSAIAKLLGARGEQPGEHRNRQGERWESFKQDIKENGIQSPIFITVDPGKDPVISEGNHRRDAALELGLDQAPVEIKYFGHAEREHKGWNAPEVTEEEDYGAAIDPQFPKLRREIPEEDDINRLIVLLDQLDYLNGALAKFPLGASNISRLQAAFAAQNKARMGVVLEDLQFALSSPGVPLEWRPFRQVFAELQAKWDAEFDRRADEVHASLVERHGQLPEGRTTPEAIVEDVGMFYGTRTSGTSNCVLAANAYELRRRGIDAHPKRASKGRYSEGAQAHWFQFPRDSTHQTYVEGLRGKRKKGRYETIVNHISATHPPGSRGTINGGWKNLSYGHIWNWEIDELGNVEFWDPQPGVRIDSDSDYWQEIDWHRVRIARLDDVPLKADIDVIAADPSLTKQITPEMEAVARKINELKIQKRRLLAELNTPENRRGIWGERGREIFGEMRIIDQQIKDLKETPAGKALTELGHLFPDLPEAKNTL